MALPAPTYTGKIDDSINNTSQGDALVNSNKLQAAKMGVTIPGATPPVPSTITDNLNNNLGGSSTSSPTGKDVYGNPVNAPVKTTVPPTGTSNGTTGTDSGSPTLSDQADRNALTQSQNDLQTAAKKFEDTITGIQGGAIPLSAGETAQVDALKQQYDQFVADQKDANDLAIRQQNILDFRQGRTQYMPAAHLKTISDLVTKGAAKVHALAVEQAGAVAKLTQALKDADIAVVKDAYAALKDANKARQDALNKTITDTQAAIDKANAAKIAADKVTYDQVTKPIQDLAQIAKDNGASNSVMAKISGSKTLDEAYQAAGNYAAQGTGVVAEYNYAKANGYTGTLMQYQTDQENMKAMAKAKADAAVNGNNVLPGIDDGAPVGGLGAGKQGMSLYEATGLSHWAMQALMQGSTALARFSQQQRVAIGNEITNWANKNNIDTATFNSQYKGLSEVVQNNQARENNTLIAGEDVSKQADNLIADMKSKGDTPKNSLFGGPIPSAYTNNDMSQLRAANILDVMIGNQTNNQFAMKYSTDLELLTNDLAGYLSASRSVGANGTVPAPDDNDRRKAASMIANGINQGGVDAFKQSFNANKDKVVQVISDATISSQKQVWDLFGVGDKFVGGPSNMDSSIQQQQKSANYNGVALPGSTTGGDGTYNGISLPH